MTVLGDHLLLSVDGTGCFSPKTVRCKHCLTKNHRDGTVTCRHRMPAGAFVHPKVRAVIPLAPETVVREDGASRNDCGQGAAIRFINDFRREHPHLKTIIVRDGLSSNVPHIRRLRAKNLRFILGAKPGDHKFLIDRAKRHEDQAKTPGIREGSVRDLTLHRFRRLTEAPINDTHFGGKVTIPDCSETKPNGRTTRWSWVTDLEVSAGYAMEVMRCARRRWVIGNGTFRTLTGGTGYSFGHNPGHGEERRLQLWRKLRAMFLEHRTPDRLTLWAAMAKGCRRTGPEVLDGHWRPHRHGHSALRRPIMADDGGFAGRTLAPYSLARSALGPVSVRIRGFDRLIPAAAELRSRPEDPESPGSRGIRARNRRWHEPAGISDS